jgi:hypothetical protein
MGGQVLRRLRLRVAGEIGRGTDDRHAEVRPDAHGDHVPGDLLPEPHAGVEALGDDVGEAIVDRDLHLHLRIGGKQPGQGGPQH